MLPPSEQSPARDRGFRSTRRAAGTLRFLVACIAAAGLAGVVIWGCADRAAPSTGHDGAAGARDAETRAAKPEGPAGTGDDRASASAVSDEAARAERLEPPPAPAKPEIRPKEQPEALPKDPPLPKYIRVLERDDPRSIIAINASTDRPDSLDLATKNVQRFRIDRRELTTAPNRSIALRVDDQVIEWTSRYSVLEFARDEQGFWQIVDRLPTRP